jgi:hypothetical protein
VRYVLFAIMTQTLDKNGKVNASRRLVFWIGSLHSFFCWCIYSGLCKLSITDFILKWAWKYITFGTKFAQSLYSL